MENTDEKNDLKLLEEKEKKEENEEGGFYLENKIS